MNSINILIYRLWKHLERKRHQQYLFLLILMFVASLSEMISIGSVLPFLIGLTTPEKLYENDIINPYLVKLGYQNPQDLLFPITILFILTAIIAGFLRLFLVVVSTRLAFATGADIGKNIFEKTLNQSYEVHSMRNSSEMIAGIVQKTNRVIYEVLISVLSLISSFIMLSTFAIVLLLINPFIVLYIFIVIGGIYGLIMVLTKNRLKKISKSISLESSLIIKKLQEGLGGIREILLNNSQKLFCEIFHDSDKKLRAAEGDAFIISTSPRYIIEALLIVIIAVVAYIFSQKYSITGIIPFMGALALGIQRMLPVCQQGYNAISRINSGKDSLIDVLGFLDQSYEIERVNTRNNPIKFKKYIEIINLKFSYSSNSLSVLDGINLKINKGSKIGFIGKTGCGKSTLIDIIMGLITPTSGSISVDDVEIHKNNIRNWQKVISHVPQNIFLTDGTIIENIAFGVKIDEIDINKVKKSAHDAHLDDLIKSLPEGYNTKVGERGVRLSGGQRQRIGIARALYKNSKVLIFDEATSALDNKTEESIMNSIYQLDQNITVIIIAHRISTLTKCDQLFEIKDKKALEI